MDSAGAARHKEFDYENINNDGDCGVKNSETCPVMSGDVMRNIQEMCQEISYAHMESRGVNSREVRICLVIARNPPDGF